MTCMSVSSSTGMDIQKKGHPQGDRSRVMQWNLAKLPLSGKVEEVQQPQA